MSLINDALQRAQQQRESGAAGDADASQPGIAKRAAPIPARQLTILAAGLAALGLILVAGVGAGLYFFVFNQEDQPELAMVSAAEIAAEAEAESEQPTENAPEAIASPATQAVPAERAVRRLPGIRPPSEDIFSEPPALVAATPAVASVEPKPETPAGRALGNVSTGRENFNPRAVAFVQAAQISGIRADGQGGGRALINGVLYRTGDTIEHELGVQLAEVRAETLVFTDASGNRYTRNF
jgi:hypothetical protein